MIVVSNIHPKYNHNTMSRQGSPTGLDAAPAVSFDDFVADSSSSSSTSSPSSSVNDDAPSSSWIHSLCHAIQMDANQTALDIVAHALLPQQPNHHLHSSSSSSSLISQQAMRLGLQILAQRILMETNHHPTNDETNTTTMLEDGITNSNSHNIDASSPTMTNTGVSSMMDETKNHPTLDIADWNLPSPPPLPPPPLETMYPAESTTTMTMTPATTDDYSHLSVQEGLNLPVEQVCPKTSVVLRRFATGFEAQQFISNSTQVHFFWYAVQGINKVRRGEARRVARNLLPWLIFSSHTVVSMFIVVTLGNGTPYL